MNVVFMGKENELPDNFYFYTLNLFIMAYNVGPA